MTPASTRSTALTRATRSPSWTKPASTSAGPRCSTATAISFSRAASRSTTLGNAVLAGQANAQLASVSGIEVGDVLTIGSGDFLETVTVAAISGDVIQLPPGNTFASAHAYGTVVTDAGGISPVYLQFQFFGRAGFQPAESAVAEGQTRNPKLEIRNKHEIRNPKP